MGRAALDRLPLSQMKAQSEKTPWSVGHEAEGNPHSPRSSAERPCPSDCEGDSETQEGAFPETGPYHVTGPYHGTGPCLGTEFFQDSEDRFGTGPDPEIFRAEGDNSYDDETGGGLGVPSFWVSDPPPGGNAIKNNHNAMERLKNI